MAVQQFFDGVGVLTDALSVRHNFFHQVVLDGIDLGDYRAHVRFVPLASLGEADEGRGTRSGRGNVRARSGLRRPDSATASLFFPHVLHILPNSLTSSAAVEDVSSALIATARDTMTTVQEVDWGSCIGTNVEWVSHQVIKPEKLGFDQGVLVYAKCDNSEPWPGYLVDIKCLSSGAKKFDVRFNGNEYSEVPGKKLYSFRTHIPRFCKHVKDEKQIKERKMKYPDYFRDLNESIQFMKYHDKTNYLNLPIEVKQFEDSYSDASDEETEIVQDVGQQDQLGVDRGGNERDDNIDHDDVSEARRQDEGCAAVEDVSSALIATARDTMTTVRSDSIGFISSSWPHGAVEL